MTSYPDTCSKATASFSVLSETVKEIQAILSSNTSTRKGMMEVSQSIQELQRLEKEKLHLTAAHHLERIRERNQGQQQEASDARIQKLLQQGVKSLQQKINETVEGINDVIDDIRCALLEEED